MARTGGRQRGTPNRITTAFRQAVQCVYYDIGGNAAFAECAREKRGEFYKIAARLIPAKITATSDNTLTVVIRRFGDTRDAPGEKTFVPALPAKAIKH